MGSSSARPLPQVPVSRRRTRALAAAAAVVTALGTASVAPAVAAAEPASPSPGIAVPTAGRPVPRTGWSWPLNPVPAVARRFEAPPQPWASGHRGVDLAASGGAVVLAAADGTVSFAGSVAGRGVLSLDHDAGVRTTYEPVTAAVATGRQVARGQPVGVLEVDPATTHCAPATCLHWGARRGGTYLDPLTLVGLAGPPVLLPLRHRGTDHIGRAGPAVGSWPLRVPV